MERSKQCILVLQGVPASGKTTWAREYVKEHKDYVIVCRDSIRESRGEYWIPEQEDYISDVEVSQIKLAIDHNLNVIIDATNLNPKTIEKWKNLAEELDCKIDFKLASIDLKTALERDRTRTRPVGEKVLKGFFKRYFPVEYESYNRDQRLKIESPEYNKDLQDCVIVDIDGTMALHNGRDAFDYSRVDEDIPNNQLITLLNRLNKNIQVIFVTGREGTDECKKSTIKWILENSNIENWIIHFREIKDYRADKIIKKEIYEKYIKPHYNVLSIFDDRDQCVEMWREQGLLCNQVYYGNF